MKRKINIQLILISVIGIFLTLILMSTLSYNILKKQVMDDLKINAELFQTTGILEEDIRSFSSPIKEIRLTVISRDGTVLYDNGASVDTMGNHLDRPEVDMAFQHGTGQAIRTSSTLNKNAFYYAILLEDGTVLRVAREANNIISIYVKTVPIIVLVIFVMIVICVILARFMTIGIVRPIEEATLNLEDYSSAVIYKELQPFLKTIRSQHEGILQSARMRQDFTANVSHELKTPLTAISGYSELIENRMVRGDEVVRFASEIHRNSDRLLYLINDIIRLSEMDTDKINIHFEEVDLYDIAKKCEPTLEMNAKQHEVCFHLEGEAVKITANRDMVSEIIMNLCDNSIKYNNPCGNVVLRIGIEDGNPMIEVKDDGIGISAEHQEHVFERFYRVDKSRSRQTGGTGLGLAIVKHICSLHQAEIILNSGVGIGTTIKIIF